MIVITRLLIIVELGLAFGLRVWRPAIRSKGQTIRGYHAGREHPRGVLLRPGVSPVHISSIPW